MSTLQLEQVIKQTMRLSPAQIQLMKMLELPTVDLNQRVNQELQENPALEEGVDEEAQKQDELENEGAEDYEMEDEYVNPLESDDYKDFSSDPDDDERSDWRENNYTGGQSLYEALKSQVYLTKMTKPQRHIAKWVLGNIDDSGFLRRTIEQLVDDYAFQEGEIIPDEEMSSIVEQIKRFDPAGVGAKDLQECLLLQLKRKGHDRAINDAVRIVTLTWQEFSQRHFSKVQERLSLTEEELRQAIEVITHLNQKPANAFEGNTSEDRHRQTIIPDFYVENNDGELIMTLNRGDIPPLHISEDYKQMEHSLTKDKEKDKEALKFVKQKMEAAENFIQALKLRNQTLYAVMSTILKMQKAFFLTGDDATLRPMKLQDVSNETGFDVSTISRVSNSKWVQTEFGVFQLKHFFSEAMENIEGDEISTREIKQILSEQIASEDKHNPLTDDQLVDELQKHGYKIARRTIAKYRDVLGIPVARLRKAL